MFQSIVKNVNNVKEGNWSACKFERTCLYQLIKQLPNDDVPQATYHLIAMKHYLCQMFDCKFALCLEASKEVFEIICDWKSTKISVDYITRQLKCSLQYFVNNPHLYICPHYRELIIICDDLHLSEALLTNP